VPSLIGDDHIDTHKIVKPLSLESKKVLAKPEMSNDIERLLLRPVKLEKEKTTIANQESVDYMFKPETEQNIEGITSILSAEKRKLNELENEYSKLEKELLGGVDAKNADLSVSKGSESSSASFSNDKVISVEKSEKKYPMKNTISSVGSSSDKPRVTKDEKLEKGISENLSYRLSKVVGNGKLLDVAECFYKLGEYNDALQTYKLITSSDVSLDQYRWTQYQIANCYRNMREFDLALSEYQRFVNQYPTGDLIESAEWYIDDVNWWKSWCEKNAVNNRRNLEISKIHKSE
jgi:tetratricopeptide (TPR) repeat protein